MKARPIISFFRTWAAPLLTVFGALIFERTKITFPHIPGIRQLWDELSNADPEEYVQLVSQDFPAFSRPSRLNVFIKLFKFFYINMTSKSVFRMYHMGRYSRSNAITGSASSKENGAE